MEYILADIIFAYLTISVCFYFLMKEKINNINSIALSKNPRNRIQLVKSKEFVKRDIRLVLVWPILVFKSIYGKNKKDK